MGVDYIAGLKCSDRANEISTLPSAQPHSENLITLENGRLYAEVIFFANESLSLMACCAVESSVPLHCVLLSSQGLRGIEPAGAPCRDHAGACGGEGEDDDDGAEDAPVEGAHAVEHLAEKPDGGGTSGEAEDETDEDGREATG